MTTHEESLDLLAAFSLDAVEEDERVALEAHLTRCSVCRAELDAYREVASGLGTIPTPPANAALWDAISSQLAGPSDHQPRPTVPSAEHRVEPTHHGRPDANAWHFPRGRLLSAGSLAIGAAAAATTLGIGLINADNRVASLQGTVAKVADSPAIAALETPGHRIVNLESAGHLRLAQFVVLPKGPGYLLQSTLPSLPVKKTYQLWGVIEGRTVSLGLLGRDPQSAAFTLAGLIRPFGLGVTVEPAGGSVRPSGPMLALGRA